MQNDLPIISPNYKNTTFFNGCIRTGLTSGFVGGLITLVNKAPNASVTYIGRALALWKNLPAASFGAGALIYLISRVAIYLLLRDHTKFQSNSKRDLTELLVNVITGVVANAVVAALTVGTGTAIASSIPAGIFIGMVTWGAVKISTHILKYFRLEKKKDTHWGSLGHLPEIYLNYQKNNTLSKNKYDVTETKYEKGRVLIKHKESEWLDVSYHPVCVKNKSLILSHIFKSNSFQNFHEKNRLIDIWLNISSRPLFEF